jgi:hypothetical protein
MAAACTVTGKVGNGQTMTAQLFSNVGSYSFAPDKKTMAMSLNGNPDQTATQEIVDISAATTITVTVSGSTHTVTVS